MAKYLSGATEIQIEQYEPGTIDTSPALLVLHGAGGAASYWVERFAPTLLQAGIALYAPRYFQKTATQLATVSMIVDGVHFRHWLAAIRDAVSYVSTRPGIDPRRIGILGISLGGYLGVAMGIEDRRVKAVIEISGGVAHGWEDRISARMAPTLILHGSEDPIVPVSEAYKLQSLLEKHQVHHEVEIFEGETHWFSSASQMPLLMRCADFLGRTVFSPEQVRKAS